MEITKEAPLAGKVIANFGDSIFGTQSGTKTEVSYYLEQFTGATVYNFGVGGCRMATYEGHVSNSAFDAFSMYRLADAIVSGDFSYQEEAIRELDGSLTGTKHSGYRDYIPEHLAAMKKLDFNDVDILTIAFGTNDYTANDIPPHAPEGNKYDTTTLEGALRYSIEKIQKAYPHINIYICTPIYRAWVDKNDNYAYFDDSTTHVNRWGYTLAEYVEFIKGVAAEYNLPVIDSYHGLGINRQNRLEYFNINDGTHPNEKGRRLLAKYISEQLF